MTINMALNRDPSSPFHHHLLQQHITDSIILKGNAAYFLIFFLIMGENDALSEYNKIPLGHNRTNGVVYSKIYFKVEICSAH